MSVFYKKLIPKIHKRNKVIVVINNVLRDISCVKNRI